MGTPGIAAIIWLSAQVAAGAVLIIAVPAIVCGWYFARRRVPAQSLWETLVMAPVSLPPVALGLILLTLLDRNGPLGPMVRAAFPDGILLTRQAAMIAAAAVGFPLMARASQQAFQAVPRELEDASRAFGAGPLRTFAHITLPLAANGMAHGALLAFARALGEFGATVIVAGIIPGETETLSLAIYGKIMAGDDGAAWEYCGWALLLTMAALALSELLRPRRR